MFAKGDNEIALYYISNIQIREMTGETQPFWMKKQKSQEESFEDLIARPGKRDMVRNFDFRT